MSRFLFLVLALAALASPAVGAATLDGRAFEIVLTSPDGKAEKDTLVFSATDADSIACHKYGFGKGPATYATAGHGTEFSFTTKSPAEGTIVWKGTVVDAAASGTMTWTKEGKDIVSTFTGTESAKGDKKADKEAVKPDEKK